MVNDTWTNRYLRDILGVLVVIMISSCLNTGLVIYDHVMIWRAAAEIHDARDRMIRQLLQK